MKTIDKLTQKVQISFVDAENNPQNVSYYITDDRNLIYYRGTAVGQGKSNLTLPKGTCTVNGRGFAFTGKYTLVTDSSNYIPTQLVFDVTDSEKISSGIYYDVLSVQKIGYGNVTVNGIQTSNTGGALGWDFEKQCYYVQGTKTSSSSARAYYLDGVAEAFAAEINLTTEKLDATTLNVPGLVLSTGKNTMELKASPYDSSKNALFINLNGAEISVSGFGNTITNQGGTMKFTAVRYDKVLFLYDQDGELQVVLSATGIYLYNGSAVSANSATYNTFVANLSGFFASANKENAIGVVTYWNKDCQGISYFDVSWNTNQNYIRENYIAELETCEFTPTVSDDYTVSVSGIEINDAYLVGSDITISLKYKDGKTIASQLEVYYGSQTEYVDGTYNLTTKRSTFKIESKAGLTGFAVSKTTVLTYQTVRGDISEIFDASATLLFTGKTDYGVMVTEDWTEKVGADGKFVAEDVASGTYELSLTYGVEKYFVVFTIANGDVVIDKEAWEKDPVNMQLKRNDWSDSQFERFYSEEDGVYYTVQNPGLSGSGAKYTYAPVTMEETNRFTLSYEVTVEKGGPLGIGLSLGTNRSSLKNDVSSIVPNTHLVLCLNGTTGKLASAYHNTYSLETSTPAVWLCDDASKENLIEGFGSTFKVTIVRDNQIIAFFVNDALVFYWNDDVNPLVAGYRVGSAAMYYGITVRSNATGSGSATFKNITCSNTANLDAYFTKVTGTESALEAGGLLTVKGTTTYNSISINQTMRSAIQSDGKISFVVPRGSYTVEAETGKTTYSAKLTANAAAVELKLSKVEEDLRPALIASAYINGAWATCAEPKSTTYVADDKVTFTGKSTTEFYTLKNAVGESYTFESVLTSDAASGMIGVGITTGEKSISFQFMPWESSNVLVVAGNHTGVGAQFFINNVFGSKSTYNPNGKVDVKITLIKTATSLTLKINDAQIAVFKSDGTTETTYAMKNDNASATDANTISAIKAIFAAKETGCGFRSNSFSQTLTAQVSFKKED